MTNAKVLLTYLGALAITLAGCGLYLGLAGVCDDNIGILLRATARVASPRSVSGSVRR